MPFGLSWLTQFHCRGLADRLYSQYFDMISHPGWWLRRRVLNRPFVLEQRNATLHEE